MGEISFSLQGTIASWVTKALLALWYHPVCLEMKESRQRPGMSCTD